jgi:hypothetical protein
VLIEDRSLSMFELKSEIVPPQSNLLDLRPRNCVSKMRFIFIHEKKTNKK